MIARTDGKDPEWENVVIPTEHYLWARNVCRSMKTQHSDLIVVSSTIWQDFHQFSESLAGKCQGRAHILLLVPGLEATKMVLDDIYLLDPETIDGKPL